MREKKYLDQGCTNPGHQVAQTTEFYVVAANICGSSTCNLLYVTLLAPRILRWHIDFGKIYALPL
jgi:hypothetical protein